MENNNIKKTSIGGFLFMMATFAVYSASGIFTKAASTFQFLSLQYIACFAGAVGVLGLYAILWQLVLKKMPLNTAFLWKSTTILFSLLFAHFIFGESITPKNILGAVFIIAGLTVLTWKK